MWEYLKKYQIIIFLSLVVGMMAWIKLTYKPTVEETVVVKPTISVPTPTAVPTTEISEAEKAADEQMPLWRLLPYQGENFLVKSYSDIDKLVVIKKGISKVETEKRVKQWLMERGQDPEKYKLEISD